MVDDDFVRAQLAIQTMAQTRAQTRALFMPSAKQADGELHCFPRSKTIRCSISQQNASRTDHVNFQGCRECSGYYRVLLYSGQTDDAAAGLRFHFTRDWTPFVAVRRDWPCPSSKPASIRTNAGCPRAHQLIPRDRSAVIGHPSTNSTIDFCGSLNAEMATRVPIAAVAFIGSHPAKKGRHDQVCAHCGGGRD